MSLPILEEIKEDYPRCKGNWLAIEHYIIPSNPIRKCEKYGYCSICWENDFKDNFSSPNPESIKHQKPFKDSKINPGSGPCSNDCL